jgi:hypothetical protein
MQHVRLRARRSAIARPLCATALALAAVGVLAPAAGAAPGAYASTIMAEPSLTSWWRLGECGPTAFDWKRGYDGRFGVQVGCDVPGAVGDSDGAADFSGAVPDQIWGSRVSTPVWFGGNAPYSLEAWVDPRTLDDRSRRIFSAEQSATGGTLVAAKDTGLVFSRYAKAHTAWRPDAVTGVVGPVAVPADWDTLTVPLATGRWTHVVATYDGVTMRLWTNGTLAGELPSSLRDRQSGYLTIGATVRGWLEWDGRIDEAALYRGPLTARQVADHHRAGTALAVPAP